MRDLSFGFLAMLALLLFSVPVIFFVPALQEYEWLRWLLIVLPSVLIFEWIAFDRKKKRDADPDD
jgi:hypothetical protein